VLRLSQSVRFVTLFFAFGIGHCSGQDFIPAEQQAQRNAFFSERVNRISTIISDAASSNWGDSEKANAIWVEAVKKSMEEFQLLASRIDRRHLVNKYIDRLGSEGDLSDFAILVSLGRHGVPSQSANSGLASQDQRATLNEEIDFYRSQQLLVAECQCRHFLRNRDSLKRYAHFLVWAGFLDRQSWRQYKSAAATSLGTDEYWWHARNALVLMEISGERADGEIGPGEIGSRFHEWLGAASEFDIDLPESKSVKHPFPNWSQKLPIAGSEFRAIFDRRILLPRDLAP
jgi:hypothetical protein